MKYLIQFAVFIKRIVIFFGSILLILWVYQFIIPDVYQRENILVALIVFWLFTAYIVLPRIHRFLSRIYIPDQFIGRTRTGDGLLSDPVNLALNGTQKEFLRAMEKAGWELAEPISIKTAWKMVKSVVLKKSYPTAPVSDAFLFGEKHKFAFQKEVAGNPHARHHVRFWKTPRGWYLPGGYKVDWLGAATYDEAVGISFFTWQFTHRICPDVDKERNFLIATLQEAGAIKKSQHIEHFFPGYRSRNGFGNHFITDGSMVIADLMSHKRK
jgi:hypothetical protein